jgi:hypothetical protein
MLPDQIPGQRPRRHRAAIRASLIKQTNVFGQNYGAADWSGVTSELMAHPDGAGNPAVMSIPLSLGNVYLNRFEVGHDGANLERAIQMFERVTSLYVLWGKREGAGSVVSYLDISLTRLEGECDVGEFASRIDALWNAAMTITADETGVPAPVEMLSILPIGEREDASRAALFAAAANFLADDPRAETWERAGRELASRFSPAVCQTQETFLALSQGALAYRLLGRGSPAEFDSNLHGARLTFAQCPGLKFDYVTTGPVAAVAPGESLDNAVSDSRVVAHWLFAYLELFPPGSGCLEDDGEDPVPFYGR